MPKLICNVSECKYNCKSMCSKYAIDVDGIDSRCKKDTKCSSFKKKDDSLLNYEFANLEEITTPTTEVYCDVVKCVFERGQKCCADKVVIKSTHNVNSKDSNVITHCETFESKD